MIDNVKIGDSFNYKAQKIKIEYECSRDNNIFEYFIYVGRVLKRGLQGGDSPPHIEVCFDFKF